MRRLVLSLLILSGFSSVTWAVSVNFTGSARFRGSNYSGLGLGVAGAENTKTFLGTRFLLEPNVVVDDHFSIRSQWSLLTSPSSLAGPNELSTPNATLPLGTGQGDYILGDATSAGLVLSRAWAEWMSDFGVLRLGRMPIAWGYGLFYDAGSGMWDDWQSTIDRLEYRLHLGHVVGAIAYSKGQKVLTVGNTNDQEFYSIYLQYNNPERETEGGILYEKQTRAANQAGVLSTNASPYYMGAGSTVPLSTKTPWPLVNDMIDVYLKQTIGYFTFGGELTFMTGTATDYAANGTLDSYNAIGLMGSATYEYHKVKAFLEFLYAPGDSNLNDNDLTGFVVLHRNRTAGLILGRELLGNYYGNPTNQGSLVLYGPNGSFSGVICARPGLRIEWTQALSSGAELVYAQKAAVPAGDTALLGIELDIGTEYQIYKNFDVGINAGYLFPGGGLGVAGAKGAWAFQGTAALRF